MSRRPAATRPAATRPTWSVTVDRYVAAPPRVVWAVVTDLEGTTARLPGVLSVERLSDDGPGAYEVGTRWRETRRMFGQEATETMEVVAVEPERRTDIRAVHGATEYRTGFELVPAGNGDAEAATLLRFHFGAHRAPDAPGGMRGWSAGALERATAPLGVAATRRSMTAELKHLALLAEERHALRT